ncbi:hypothetical protein Tco_1163715 [Tanacetum coccineum]
MLWHQNSECQTTPTEFWCHGISGAKLYFADVASLLESFYSGKKSSVGRRKEKTDMAEKMKVGDDHDIYHPEKGESKIVMWLIALSMERDDNGREAPQYLEKLNGSKTEEEATHVESLKTEKVRMRTFMVWDKEFRTGLGWKSGH